MRRSNIVNVNPKLVFALTAFCSASAVAIIAFDGNLVSTILSFVNIMLFIGVMVWAFFL